MENNLSVKGDGYNQVRMFESFVHFFLTDTMKTKIFAPLRTQDCIHCSFEKRPAQMENEDIVEGALVPVQPRPTRIGLTEVYRRVGKNCRELVQRNSLSIVANGLWWSISLRNGTPVIRSSDTLLRHCKQCIAGHFDLRVNAGQR